MQPVHIMLLEDNPGDVRLVQEHFKRILQLEVRLTHVDRLALAAEMLETCQFDVALFDLNLPDGSASETLNLIRETTCDVPIIVLTGYDDDEVGLQALKAGAQDYLTKEDVTPRRLYRSITYAMERKAATDAFRLQSAALNASANAILITDAQGIIQWINPAFEQITGFSREEAVGATPSILKSGIHSEDFYSGMWQAIQRGEVWTGDVVNRHRDGSLYTDQLTITPVRDDRGNISGFISIQQDISELCMTQVALEDRTFQLNERMKELRCLLDVTRILDDDEMIFAQKMARIAARLPAGWLDPSRAHARVRVRDDVYESEGFEPGEWVQKALIVVEGQTIGEVMVCYRTRPTAPQGGVFMAEEQALLESIAAQIAKAVEKEAAIRRDHLNRDRLISILAINEAQVSSRQAYLDIAVDDMARLTGSEIGYIRLMGEEPGTIEMDAWSSRVNPEHLEQIPMQYVIQEGTPCADAMRTRQPMVENSSPREACLGAALDGQLTVQRHMVVPIFDGSDLVLLAGMINKDADYTQADVDQVRLYATSLWNLIRSREAELKVRRHVRQLELVNEVANRIALQLNLNEVTQKAAGLIQEAFAYDHVGVFILEGDTAWLRASAGKYADRLPPNHHLQGGVGMVGKAARTGEMQVSNNVQASAEYFNPFNEALIGSELAIPIKARSRVIGVLDVQSHLVKAFDETDHVVLRTLADQLATAIINARLYEEVTGYNETLQLQVESAVYELQRAVEQGAAILNNSPIGILLLDRGGVIEVANPEAQEQFRNSEMYGQHLRDLLALEAPREFNALLVSALDSDRSVTFEAHLPRGDAEPPLEVEVALAQVVGSESAGVVCTIRDISAFKEVARMKDAFVSNVSHELRTPITGLKLNHRLLEKDPERAGVYLDRLGREIDRLNVLIEDLLRLSRLDQGRVELIHEACPINAVIEHHVADRLPIARARGLNIDLDLTPDLPPAWADPGLIEQALSVLLTNALNYNSEGGTILIRSFRQVEPDGKPMAGFSVEDNGPGISSEDLPHLSERFYRGEASRLTSAPGTGLGLAIAREIVGQHQGRLEIESSGVPGEGALFRVLLPQMNEEMRDDE